jgi:hypothetical protein
VEGCCEQVINLRVAEQLVNFLTSWVTINFSRDNVQHGITYLRSEARHFSLSTTAEFRGLPLMGYIPHEFRTCMSVGYRPLPVHTKFTLVIWEV